VLLKEKTDVDDADSDLKTAIRAGFQKSPKRWEWRHIKGHQYNGGTSQLDRWVMLNIEMDNLAKA
jgi:hypothetical protein